MAVQATQVGMAPATAPAMSLCSSGLETNMAPDGNTVHHGLFGSGGNMTLGHQYDLQCWPISWVSAQPSVVTGATDIDCNMAAIWTQATTQAGHHRWQCSFFSDLIEDLVYALDLGFFSFIFAYNSKVWVFPHFLYVLFSVF